MSARVQRVWEIYDDRLQFMTRIDDALALDESLDAGAVFALLGGMPRMRHEGREVFTDRDYSWHPCSILGVGSRLSWMR